MLGSGLVRRDSILTALGLLKPFGLRALRSLPIALQSVEPSFGGSRYSILDGIRIGLSWDCAWELFSVEGFNYNSLWAVVTLRASRFALVADCVAIGRTLFRV